MKPSTSRFAAAASLAISSTALAQSSVIIDVADPVLMPGQSTTVTLWAAFPAREYAMAQVALDLLTSVDIESWSHLELLPPMNRPGSTPGSLTSFGIDGIVAGQINSPVTGALQDNPIAFWRARYTAPTDVGSSFDVHLSTLTSQFDVYIESRRPDTRSYLSTLTEGQATIHIIPAPAGAVVLGFGVLVAGRRRR